MAQQPIIRGVQAVGSVAVHYEFQGSTNGKSKTLAVPSMFRLMNGSTKIDTISTGGGIELSGFRLDSQFVQANPQIASSFVIPLLGGGGMALTNNNRTGTLVLQTSRVSTPAVSSGDVYMNLDFIDATAQGTMSYEPELDSEGNETGNKKWSWEKGTTTTKPKVYDGSLIAQIQQGQELGDSAGATIAFTFMFCNTVTVVAFNGCTVASVIPLALSGNNVPDYQVSWNYLNWGTQVGGTEEGITAAQTIFGLS